VIVKGATLEVDLINLDTLEPQFVTEGLDLSWDGQHIYIRGAQSGLDIARYTLEELEE
jgi:hypothetical protein